MKLLALIADTFREIYAKKVILGIIVIQVITLVITGIWLFSGQMQKEYREAATGVIEAREGGPGEVPDRNLQEDDSVAASFTDSTLTDSADTSAAPPVTSSKTFQRDTAIRVDPAQPDDRTLLLQGKVVGQLSFFAGGIFGAALFLGILAAAGIIPSMMEKGTIDLLLSKPLQRSFLLFGRAAGGIAAITINLILFVLAVWAVYGTASGIWYVPFVTSTIAYSFFGLVVLYSAVILLNVVTENWVLALMLAWIHSVILSPLLSTRDSGLLSGIDSPVIQSILDGLYYILPPLADLNEAVMDAVYTSSAVPTGVVIHCAIFTIIMLALAAWRFEKKDF